MYLCLDMYYIYVSSLRPSRVYNIFTAHLSPCRFEVSSPSKVLSLGLFHLRSGRHLHVFRPGRSIRLRRVRKFRRGAALGADVIL